MLIKNATVCDKRECKKTDVRIEGTKIQEISDSLAPYDKERVIDAKGLYLLPGLIDIGASIGEGVSDVYKALKKLSNFAIRGGVTTLAVQPDTAINTEIGLDYFFSKSKEISLCALTPIASATENNGGEKLNNLAIIYKNGAVGSYLPSSANSNILKRSLEYGKMYEKPVFVRCFNESLDKGALMHEGLLSFSMGLGGFSVVSESSELARVVDIASYVGSRLVVRGLSSEKSVEIAKNTKRRYKNVFFDVSLHNLILTDESCKGYNSYAKNFPPLREERDKESLAAAILGGYIDVVSSGHKPVARVAKDLSFEEAAFGIESLEFFLSALYALSAQKGISLTKISELTSYNPAKILGLQNKGLVEEGYDADLTLFCPNSAPNRPHDNSPYLKASLKGSALYTIKDGEIRFCR